MLRISFLTTLLLTNISFAQKTLSGSVVDTNNKPIEYVNISVLDTKKGTISDKEGHYTLDASALKASDSLLYSHIGHKSKLFALKDVPKEVFLEEEEIAIPEVVVNAKMPKMKTIKGKGARFPALVLELIDTDLNEETGDFVILKKDHIAKSFELNVKKNTFDKLILRLVFYKTDTQKEIFEPLIQEPIYVEIPKSKKVQRVKKDIRVPLPKGIVWIGVEMVEVIGNTDAKLAMGARMTGAWVRAKDNSVEKIPLGVGIPFSIKGYQSEE